MIIKEYEYGLFSSEIFESLMYVCDSLVQEIRSGSLKIVLLTVCFLFLSSEVEKLKAPGGWLLVID